MEKVRPATPEARVLEGRVMATLFYEPSTRTRLSFEVGTASLYTDTAPDYSCPCMTNAAAAADIAATDGGPGVCVCVCVCGTHKYRHTHAHTQLQPARVIIYTVHTPPCPTMARTQSAITHLGGAVLSTESAGEYSSAAKGETLEGERLP
jgi:aspartate carbamoyltransferase catalytic subunit